LGISSRIGRKFDHAEAARLYAPPRVASSRTARKGWWGSNVMRL
jgi:hypothetical protein